MSFQTKFKNTDHVLKSLSAEQLAHFTLDNDLVHDETKQEAPEESFTRTLKSGNIYKHFLL